MEVQTHIMNAVPAASGYSPVRVLVVDDDPVIRSLVSLMLETRGYAITVQESGESAICYLEHLGREERPNVLLIDLNLPGIARAELAGALRPFCPPPSILIAMSANDPSDRVRASFDEFLRKPFSLEDFVASMDRAAKHPLQGALTSFVRTADETSSEAVTHLVLNESVYLQFASALGEQQLSELYALFLADATDRVTRLRSAAKIGDAGKFVREAHGIKGSCGMVGATALHRIAAELESGGLTSSVLLDDFESAVHDLRRILIGKNFRSPKPSSRLLDTMH